MGKLPRSSSMQKAKSRKTKHEGNLAEFFADSPLRGSGLRIRRSKDRGRKIKL